MIQNGIRSQCSEDPGAAVRFFHKRQEDGSGWEMLQRWWNEHLYRCGHQWSNNSQIKVPHLWLRRDDLAIRIKCDYTNAAVIFRRMRSAGDPASLPQWSGQ